MDFPANFKGVHPLIVVRYGVIQLLQRNMHIIDQYNDTRMMISNYGAFYQISKIKLENRKQYFSKLNLNFVDHPVTLSMVL